MCSFDKFLCSQHRSIQHGLSSKKNTKGTDPALIFVFLFFLTKSKNKKPFLYQKQLASIQEKCLQKESFSIFSLGQKICIHFKGEHGNFQSEKQFFSLDMEISIYIQLFFSLANKTVSSFSIYIICWTRFHLI